MEIKSPSARHVVDKTPLIRQSVERLKTMLLCESPVVALNFTKSVRLARGFYKVDLELVTGDKLSLIQNSQVSKAKLAKLYMERFKTPVLNIYEEVLTGKRKAFPPQFWTGHQGKLNLIICYKHVLEDKYGFKMDEKTKQIDRRLFRNSQAEFLRSACGKEDWISFFLKHKLAGGLNTACNNSIFELMQAAYPWAFNLNTPEGAHLHRDDFRQNDIWNGPDGDKNAKSILDHRIRNHMGIRIDEKNKAFDPRLLRENQAALLNELGQTNWRDVFIADGLGGFLVTRKDFDNQVGKVFEWLYPWAFDRTKPEGKHLHFYDFEGRNRFKSDLDVRSALLHEAKPEGWQIEDFPEKMTKKWLIDHNIILGNEYDKLTLFRRAFKEEFRRGLFSEANFRNQDTQRKIKPSSYRMIKKTNASGTTYGIIHVGKTAYHFPAALIGYYARQESSEHGVIYETRKTAHGEGKTGYISKPVKMFLLAKKGASYSRPELIDLDQAKYPILSKEIRNALAENGVNPQDISVFGQKLVIRYVGENGIIDLPTLLKQIGLMK